MSDEASQVDDWAEDWAEKEAAKAAQHVLGAHKLTCDEHENLQQDFKDLALEALAAAEGRVREECAKVADKYAEAAKHLDISGPYSFKTSKRKTAECIAAAIRAAPSTLRLTWTERKPVTVGWWWWKWLDRVRVVTVHDASHVLAENVLVVDGWGLLSELEGLWSGPLEPPTGGG